MKKNHFSFSVCLFTSYIVLCTSYITYAQDLRSRKGESFLPDSGDYAISFDAMPFLNYAGNLFSGNTSANNSPTASWVDPTTMTITGKQFTSAKTAYRGTVRIGFVSVKESGLVPDAAATTAPVYPSSILTRSDVHKVSKANIGVGIGKEWRRGKTRLQGLYGAEGMIWMSAQSQTYEYGNALSSTVEVDTTTGTTYNFGSNITTDEYGNMARIKKEKEGTLFGLGIRGFVGAEYFLIPKISVGAEYGWGIGVVLIGEGTTQIESVGGSPATKGEQTLKTGKAAGFGMDNDINGGTGSGTAQLKVTFHF
ncbi:MAG: hypothetical protein HY841_06000 [Bacteroidetes bacterium]|nr:hypothetical protein [Bacteroidota bacterium]